MKMMPIQMKTVFYLVLWLMASLRGLMPRMPHFSYSMPFVLLPYLEENIIFVNFGMNTCDNSRIEFFEKGEKFSLNNPELKLRGSHGWNMTLVEEVRKNFASEKGSEASLSVASSWE